MSCEITGRTNQRHSFALKGDQKGHMPAHKIPTLTFLALFFGGCEGSEKRADLEEVCAPLAAEMDRDTQFCTCLATVAEENLTAEERTVLNGVFVDFARLLSLDKDRIDERSLIALNSDFDEPQIEQFHAKVEDIFEDDCLEPSE